MYTHMGTCMEILLRVCTCLCRRVCTCHFICHFNYSSVFFYPFNYSLCFALLCILMLYICDRSTPNLIEEDELCRSSNFGLTIYSIKKWTPRRLVQLDNNWLITQPRNRICSVGEESCENVIRRWALPCIATSVRDLWRNSIRLMRFCLRALCVNNELVWMENIYICS